MKNVVNSFKDLLISKYPNVDVNSLESYCNKFETIISELNELGINIEEKRKSIFSNIGKKDYLNYVCELSIIYHFASKFPNNFKCEVDSEDNKNYDFYFYKDQLKINVEVKSLSPSDNEGRTPVKLFLPKELEQELYNQGVSNLTRTTNKKIIDLLTKADHQLPCISKENENEINIALLCVSDLDEYADVVTNLIHSEIGILSNNNFNKIDCILVCNIGFEHNFLLDKTIYENYMMESETYSLQGEFIWDYQRSIPVLPMLFWVKQSSDRSELIQKNTMEAMFSHTSFLMKRLENNTDIQSAIFNLYNDIPPIALVCNEC